MADFDLGGIWDELKGKVKQTYADLTDNDLTYEKGKEDEVLGKLEQKTGKSREELMEWLKKLSSHSQSKNN